MDSTILVSSIVLGAIGMAYLSFGKIHKRVIPMVGGAVLILLPYFDVGIYVGILVVVLVVVSSYFVAF